jgi:predicted O-methyltransferase YrrM
VTFLQHFIDFVKHFTQAKTRHGVHSPFVYALIDECLYAHEPAMPVAVRSRYSDLVRDHSPLRGMDHGKGMASTRTIAYYARNSAMNDQQAALLHRFVHRVKPRRAIELGTNLGKSLASMATAYSEGEFTGVEGNAALADQAQKNMHALELSHAHIVHNTFDGFLENVHPGVDLIFIDGDHHYEPTMRYFNRAKSLLSDGGCVVLHDIYWSEGMKRAWSEIKKDRAVTVTVDLFFLGFVFFGNRQAKEDFKIRFPLRLCRLFV